MDGGYLWVAWVLSRVLSVEERGGLSAALLEGYGLRAQWTLWLFFPKMSVSIGLFQYLMLFIILLIGGILDNYWYILFGLKE
jgi:hypothetical protein